MSGVKPKGHVDGNPAEPTMTERLQSAIAEARASKAVSGSPEADAERKAKVEDTADWLRRDAEMPESDREANHDALEIEARAHMDHLRG